MQMQSAIREQFKSLTALEASAEPPAVSLPSSRWQGEGGHVTGLSKGLRWNGPFWEDGESERASTHLISLRIRDFKKSFSTSSLYYHVYTVGLRSDISRHPFNHHEGSIEYNDEVVGMCVYSMLCRL